MLYCEVVEMKRIMVLLVAFIVMHASTALAAKARSIENDLDSQFHAGHLMRHLGETSCRATGNYLKTRSQSNEKEIIGHLEQADVFRLMDVKDGYALVSVIASHATSPDSWEGMSGWVNSDYIDCTCPTESYLLTNDHRSIPADTEEDFLGYTKILDWFLQAISEKWDFQKIADADFEPQVFPDSLVDSGFIFWDINNDGIQELFVFKTGEYEPVLAGYTLVDGYPKRIFSSWARNRHYLRTDGSVFNEGSNGASYSVTYVFDLVGHELVVREGVLSGDYQENGETKYGWFLVDERADFTYTDHKLISDEEAMRRMEYNKSTVIYGFEHYMTFAEYAARHH